MKRREFITLLGGGAVAWPLAGLAQQSSKVFRIGYVSPLAANSLPQRLDAFRAGLRDLGYEEGRNIVIEYRWAEERYDRLPALFADVVRLNVDVIVTHGTPGALAAKQATKTIPIVMAAIADAEASGVVASLARPGGNVDPPARRRGDRITILFAAVHLSVVGTTRTKPLSGYVRCRRKLTINAGPIPTVT